MSAYYLYSKLLRSGVSRHIGTEGIDIAAGAREVRVPVMLLQTVVENAIKHGIAELPGGGVLRISAMLGESALNVEVRNPRPATSTPREQQGSGLHNAAERLRLLFGSRADLELDLSQSDLAIVRIQVPKEVAA